MTYKIETAFYFQDTTRTEYVYIAADELPRRKEKVRLSGVTNRVDNYTVTEITRTYDPESGRLTYVNVLLEPGKMPQ